MQELKRLPEFAHVEKILPVEIRDAVQLADFEEQCLSDGYEGVMVRTPDSPYKCGRSTEREGWLLKIKRFDDAEAVILETYEGMSNQNEAQRDAFGRTKRSSAQAGKIGRGELGGFVVRIPETGVEFRLGYTLGLKQRFTRPYTPKTNGKAERFIQTSQREWAYAHAYSHSDHRASRLPPFLHNYNWHRPHHSLNLRSPISRLRHSLNNLLSLHT